MINVTVKTLDSQNHQFSVDDEITVRQFKEHIAEKVNVEADLQRIIYCGRLLKDEKFLREYDVNGKVVHLVQRAPPTTVPTTSTTETPPQNRWRVRNLNARSPLIRAIDGMVLGAMAIPMNASNGAPQAPAPSLNPSSTLCMNRITVARHMLECANNIARFLENPEGGLNNAAMEDLAQQSLESTVFEVGISAVGEMDIPQVQMQNLMHAFQGAVTAALRQNGVPNIRVMQPGAQPGSGERPAEAVPSVQVPEAASGEDAAATGDAAAATTRPQSSSTTESPSSQSSPTAGAEGAAAAPGQRPRQQTTRTQVLATVVQQMRDVQARLEPFVQQYYDILQNDPTYETEDERNTAQRVFDHVSEAFHYISHAQHAISDLMLCLSSTTPRHLCCRPILVEQSAFVSSEFTVPFPIQANLANVTRPNGNNNETAAAAGVAVPQNTGQGENNNASTMQQQQQEGDQQRGNNDGPQAAAPLRPGGAPQPAEATTDDGRMPRGIPRNIFSLFLPIANRTAFRTENGVPASGNQELQIARIIQAVVNTAPVDADLQVEINPPQSSASTSNQPSTATTTAATASNATLTPNEWTINVHLGDIGLGNVIGGGLNQVPRVTTVTLPTTSTQTRSTARQQMHTANIPAAQMRNFRPASGNLFSVFDRFLPCNSHHIWDRNGPQGAEQRARANQATQAQNQATQSGGIEVTQADAPHVGHIGQTLPSAALRAIRQMDSTTFADLLDPPLNPDMINEIYPYLQAFVHDTFFNGTTVSEESTAQAVDVFLRFVEYILDILPRSDDSDYDARASIENLLRSTLPRAFEIILSEYSADFGGRFLRFFRHFCENFCRILLLCFSQARSRRFVGEMRYWPLPNVERIQVFRDQLFREVQRIIEQMRDVGTHDERREMREQVQPYLVIRGRAPPAERSCVGQQRAQEQPPEEPMETDEVIIEKPSHSQTSMSVDAEPPVEIEPQPWHRHFPSDWIPIITQDVQKQRRQPEQQAFSDAYLMGMSSKRRKLIASAKPPADVQEVLSEGVRQAIKATGLTCASQTSVDDVSRAIATDSNVQSSYQDEMKQRLQSQAEKHPDYKRDRFPYSYKYFK